IGEPGEGSAGEIDGRDDDLTAERDGFIEIGPDVVDLHIEDRVVERFVAERGDVARDAAAGARIYRGGGAVLHVPAEQAREELRRLRAITAADLKMNDGLSH